MDEAATTTKSNRRGRSKNGNSFVRGKVRIKNFIRVIAQKILGDEILKRITQLLSKIYWLGTFTIGLKYIYSNT